MLEKTVAWGPMRIGVLGINYSPELIGIAPYTTDMCEFLGRKGHDVTVITGFPYYPHWTTTISELYSREIINGVTVLRCWLYVPRVVTTATRILHELSFTVTAVARLVSLPRFDRLILIAPPLPMAVAAGVMARFRREKVVVHIQDLQPDAAIAMKMIKNPLLIRFLEAMSALLYNLAWRVSAISPQMCSALRRKGLSVKKLRLIPNWVAVSAQGFPRELGWKVRSGTDESTRIVAYTGNFGVKQGLEVVLETAEILRARKDILFVLVGEGAMASALRSQSHDLGLSNVLFLDILDEQDHGRLLAETDLFLLPQREGSCANFFPSKLLKAIAMGCPVVSNASEDSALACAIREGGFGSLAAPNDAKSLATVITALLDNPEAQSEMRTAARTYAVHFDRDKVLAKIARILDEVD